jgi:mono/diheme cytochrome c family protein
LNVDSRPAQSKPGFAIPDKWSANRRLETALLVTPAAPPEASEQVRHGEYLAHLGNCAGCHDAQTPDRKAVVRLELAGGRVLRGRWGVVTSQNITPDASGIGYYDEQKFIAVMPRGTLERGSSVPLCPGQIFAISLMLT